MGKIGWGIVGLSEVRRVGEELIQRKDGNYFFLYGETKDYRGVGFYISERMWKRVKDLRGIQ